MKYPGVDAMMGGHQENHGSNSEENLEKGEGMAGITEHISRIEYL